MQEMWKSNGVKRGDGLSRNFREVFMKRVNEHIPFLFDDSGRHT